MILIAQCEPLNLSVKLTIENKDYTIFISSESMKCFICGDLGHFRQTCPNRNVVNEEVAVYVTDTTEDAVPLQLSQATVQAAPSSSHERPVNVSNDPAAEAI